MDLKEAEDFRNDIIAKKPITKEQVRRVLDWFRDTRVTAKGEVKPKKQRGKTTSKMSLADMLAKGAKSLGEKD